MINPYTCYIASLCMTLPAYVLGWSALYPSLSTGLFVFLLITLVSHIALAFYWKRNVVVETETTRMTIHPIVVTCFIYFLWSVDFMYEGGIPLIKIITHQPYNYRLFGVPSLHVFIVTFSSFYTVYLFGCYLNAKQKTYLVLYTVNLAAAVLIYNRGMLLFNLVSSVCLYLMHVRKLSVKSIAVLGGITLIVIYLFGVMGTLRVSFEAKRNYDNELFLGTGRATTTFRDSPVPNEFFWAYIYISSPLANLQQNINSFSVKPISGQHVVAHITNEMMPDFISKRIDGAAHISRETENTLKDTPFNVSTVYSRSYSYQGWWGMVIMAVFVLGFPVLYLLFTPANPYRATGVAILCSMYLFLFFDNTIRFTGFVLQLAYPLVFTFADMMISRFQQKLSV